MRTVYDDLHSTTDAAGLHTYHYEGPNGALSGESISGGLLDGAVLSYGYHASNHRRDEVTWSWAGASRSTEHGFDAAGRLESVSAFGREALYGYDAVSGRRTSLAYGNGGPEGIWEYDSLDRLKAVKWKRGTVPLTRHVYGFDSMDRRRTATRETGEQWRYGYNSRGEVIHAVKARHGGEDAPLRPGMQTGYDHDLAGNRTNLEEEGSDGPLVAAWTANEANQITEREILPERWVLGVAAPEAALQVSGHDGGAPQREGWEFAVPAAKAQAAGVAEWKELEITASRSGPPPATTEKEGSLWFAASPESLTYDADGNLTGDGRWTYEWTAENRLAAMETRPGAMAAGAPGKRLEFAYDAVGRRVAKRVLGFMSSGGTMTLEKELRYLYDGWNMIAEFQMGLGGVPALLRAYAWGNDVSADGQQAGGVGGLVYVQEASGVTLTPCYDGNGNVTAYVEGVTGAVVSKQDYGAFGEKVWEERRRAGNLPPFGYSTKYEDEETGLLYYGYRYYSPEMGRWISRDPIEEQGGINLYGMVGNDPVNKTDYLGLHKGIVAGLDIIISTDRATLGAASSWIYFFSGTGVKGVDLTKDGSIEACNDRWLVVKVENDPYDVKAMLNSSGPTVMAGADLASGERKYPASTPFSESDPDVKGPQLWKPILNPASGGRTPTYDIVVAVDRDEWRIGGKADVVITYGEQRWVRSIDIK